MKTNYIYLALFAIIILVIGCDEPDPTSSPTEDQQNNGQRITRMDFEYSKYEFIELSYDSEGRVDEVFIQYTPDHFSSKVDITFDRSGDTTIIKEEWTESRYNNEYKEYRYQMAISNSDKVTLYEYGRNDTTFSELLSTSIFNYEGNKLKNFSMTNKFSEHILSFEEESSNQSYSETINFSNNNATKIEYSFTSTGIHNPFNDFYFLGSKFLLDHHFGMPENTFLEKLEIINSDVSLYEGYALEYEYELNSKGNPISIREIPNKNVGERPIVTYKLEWEDY